MKKYPVYKPSGIEWLGEIPEHWTKLKFRWLFRVSSGDFLTSENECEEGFPVYGGNGLRGFSKQYNNEGMMLLLGRVGAKCGNVHLIDGKYWVSEHALRVLPKVKFDFEYFKYFLEFYDFNRFANQTAQPLINSESVLDKYSLFPNLGEQKKISQFLNHNTNLIDTLIDKKPKLIDLLKEYRTAIINQAVTKGLDPDVKMKDSEIEWLGEVPEHWEVRKLRTLGRFSKGRGISKEDTVPIGLPCIRYGEIYTKYDRIVSSPISFVNEQTSLQSESINKGAVLFTGSGETIEDIGKSVVYNGDYEAFVGGDIIILRLIKDIHPIFISYLMNCHYVIFQKSIAGKGEIIVHIYSKDLKDILISIPSYNEQNQIVHYLDKKTTEIDTQIEKEQNFIEYLKEYRTALISEVVTGKVDVRDYNLNTA